MPILEAKNLAVSYGGEKILEGVTFTIDQGDSLAIIGPNGAGKTTLFRAILGSIPHQGSLTRSTGVTIGYVPQKIDLERDLPLTVEEFLSLRPEAGQKTKTIEEISGLIQIPGSYRTKRISELSSGEFQRVLIGWAIINNPSLLLFDEPTASIDITGQEKIYELLHELQDKQSMTLMIISHDLTVVYRYANKVLCLNKTKTCFGSPHEVLTPQELEKLYGGTSKFYKHPHD